jgi:hypothetical protein
LKPDVLKPDILKPDVLKPDVLWVYRTFSHDNIFFVPSLLREGAVYAHPLSLYLPPLFELQYVAPFTPSSSKTSEIKIPVLKSIAPLLLFPGRSEAIFIFHKEEF